MGEMKSIEIGREERKERFYSAAKRADRGHMSKLLPATPLCFHGVHLSPIPTTLLLHPYHPIFSISTTPTFPLSLSLSLYIYMSSLPPHSFWTLASDRAKTTPRKPPSTCQRTHRSIDRDLVLKMSPATHFHEHISGKRERDANCGNNNKHILKINKDSHLIKKSSSSSPLPPSSSSSSATSSAKPQQQRHHPVIIYTHSPKVIHTHPRDFMALVQKLTGLSRSDDNPPRPKPDPDASSSEDNTTKNQKAVAASADDNDSSSSVVTDENCGSTVVGNVEINSCFPSGTHHHPPIFDASNPCFSNIPLFSTNSCDFLCPAAAQPFYNNYAESLLLMPSMRTSISSASSSALEAMNEFREF
ncbi:VQ motif-containing protein 20-like [Diospyros lotus]|uniref:VQ motif-containing protein 20-like n=1 Tax=Diospyros lotus TaxID=55363 RepID=UPI00225BBE45|nr:VQ motif-containing protein 20-like [Diospyros lotus]